MEARMHQTEIDHYRKKLERVRGMLMKAYSIKRHAVREFGEEGPHDLADKATSSYAKEILCSVGSNELRVLLEIDRALGRMREKVYGACVECEEKISRKRLEAAPWVSLCVSCQQAAEGAVPARLVA